MKIVRCRQILLLLLAGTITSGCVKKAKSEENSKEKIIKKILETQKASFLIYTYDEYGMLDASGSGFFIGEDGIGITNYHVLDGSTKAVLKTSDSLVYEIDKIIAADKDKDIVKFQVKNKENRAFPFLSFTNKVPQKGDQVYCISNPLDYDNSLSDGIISAMRPEDEHGMVVQSTAATFEGSSGSALLNDSGQVIGVIYGGVPGTGINLAVYANKDIIESIKQDEFSKNNPKFSSGNQFVIINENASNDPFTILNAIEFGKDITTCYFTTFKLNPDMSEIEPDLKASGIWLELNKGDQGFFLKDKESNTNYYLTSSSVGDSREDITETPTPYFFQYKVFLPAIKSDLKTIDISAGNDDRYPHWLDIDLNQHKRDGKFDQIVFELVKGFGLWKFQGRETAEEQFKKVLELDPQNICALNALGIISFLKDNNKDARDYYDLAIEYNPIIEESYINRYFLNRSLGKDDEALKDLNSAIRLAPSHPEYYLYREGHYLNQDEKDAAMNEYFKAKQILDRDYHREMASWSVEQKQAIYDSVLTQREREEE